MCVIMRCFSLGGREVERECGSLPKLGTYVGRKADANWGRSGTGLWKSWWVSTRWSNSQAETQDHSRWEGRQWMWGTWHLSLRETHPEPCCNCLMSANSHRFLGRVFNFHVNVSITSEEIKLTGNNFLPELIHKYFGRRNRITLTQASSKPERIPTHTEGRLQTCRK